MRRIATCLLCVVICGAAARGQTNIGVRTGDGATVNIGDRRPDPKNLKERYRKRCRHLLKQAGEHLDAERWYDARVTLEAAWGMVAVDKSLVKTAIGLFTRLDAEGKRLLRRADDTYDREEYLEALKAYGLISRVFGTRPAGMSALASLRIARKDPQVRRYLQEAKAQVLDELVDRKITGFFAARGAARVAAATQPATTRPASPPPATTQPAAATTQAITLPASRTARIRLMSVEKQAEVIDLMDRIARLYGDSPTGQNVAAELENLRADEKLQTSLKKYRRARMARQMLQRAEMYRKAGMLKKALKLCKEVVEDYPHSPEAVQAAASIRLLDSKVRSE